MKKILLLLFVGLALTGYSQTKAKSMKQDNCDTTCGDDCEKKLVVCKLTSPQMRQRKATVIASLKKQVLEKKELDNGYSYRFSGSDKVVTELSTFIKTERLCCEFFDFSLAVKGDKSSAWLTITGPEGAKSFITSELEL